MAACSDCRELQEEIDMLEQRIDELKADLGSKKEQIDELEADLQTKEDRIGVLEEAVSDGRCAVDNALDYINSAMRELDV